MGSARPLRPIPERQRRIDPGSVSAAITRMRPLQSGQTRTSMRKTRASNFAHDSRWRPDAGRAWAEPSSASSALVAGGGTSAGSFSISSCGDNKRWVVPPDQGHSWLIESDRQRIRCSSNYSLANAARICASLACLPASLLAQDQSTAPLVDSKASPPCCQVSPCVRPCTKPLLLARIL